jgi:outer membrane autotransporter protein
VIPLERDPLWLGLALHKNTVWRRSLEDRFTGRIVSAVCAAFVVLPVATVALKPALAQSFVSFVANGTTVTASGTAITLLQALNGGVINSSTPLRVLGGNPVQAESGGTINIFSGSTVQAFGDALIARGVGSTVTVTNTAVTTVHSGAFGAVISNGGTINILGGSTITTASTGAFATSGGTFNINGSTISAGTGVQAASRTTAFNLTDSTVTAGVAFLVQLGNATLIADASHITGAMVTTGGTSTTTLSGGTVWVMTGNSNLTSLTNNAGTINFTAPTGDPELLASYKTLTVGSYIGQAGVIALNTLLGGDGSPSDRLIVTGTATGATNLAIRNSGGPGTETTGDGILVVQTSNGGTTAPGAFALIGEARAGAYDYDLFRGGISGSDPNDWFLRSSFVVGPPPLPGQPEPEPFPPGVLPPDPPLGPLPPGIYPIIGPEIATDGVVQPIARQLGLTTLSTLHERAGDTLEGSCSSAATANIVMPAGAAPVAPDGGCKPGLWGRVFGQSINNSYQAFADPRASGQIAGIQTGFDVWRGSLIAGHSDTAGIYLSYGNAHVDVDGLVTNPAATGYVISRTGTVGLNAYSSGAYWTHYGPTGWYVDAVVQGTGYDGSATTQFANLPLTGSGVVTSLEGGYPISLPWFGPRFVLEPQGQIIWQQVSFKEANDGLGPVGLGTTSGTTGRLGLRGQWAITGANGMIWQPYVRANISRDWGAEATTTFGIDQVPLIEQATRLELAGGVTAKLGASLSVFAQGGYQFATSESGPNGFRRDSVKGDVGVRYTW